MIIRWVKEPEVGPHTKMLLDLMKKAMKAVDKNGQPIRMINQEFQYSYASSKPLNEVGKKGPYHRYTEYPVELTTEIKPMLKLEDLKIGQNYKLEQKKVFYLAWENDMPVEAECIGFVKGWYFNSTIDVMCIRHPNKANTYMFVPLEFIVDEPSNNTKSANSCTCSINVLMSKGCICGHINKVG